MIKRTSCISVENGVYLMEFHFHDDKICDN